MLIRRHTAMAGMAAGVLLLGYVFCAEAQVLDPNITVRIEEPANDETKVGVANFRGFATTPFGDCPIVRVELSIDGTLRGNIPIGGARADVCNDFNNPDCATSGYSQAINYSNFEEGAHSASVRAVDCFGNFNDASVSFNTDRFDNSFISDSTAINFLTTQVSINTGGDGSDKRIFLNAVSADNVCYDITLDYATAIQGWQIVSIEPAPGNCF